MSLSTFMPDSKVLKRISNLSPVSNLLSLSSHLYHRTKENASAIGFVEEKIHGGFQWLAPNGLDPLLQNPLYKDYAQPLLLKVDDVGDSTLLVLESQLEAARTKLQSSKEIMEKTVDSAKESAFATAKRVGDNLFPIDDYLGTSVLGKPLNFAVDVGELLITKYLPGEIEEEGDSANVGGKQQQAEEDVAPPSPEERAIQPDLHNGPVMRASRLSLVAYNKLHSFSTRTLDTQKPLHYTIGLLQFAAQTLDKGVAVVKQTGTHLMPETNISQKVHSVTQEAIAAVHLAIETISKQLPTSSRLQISLDASGTSEGVFASVAQRSSGLLHDVSSKLSAYVQQGETIPKQLLQSSIANLYQVLDGLQIVLRSRTHSGKEEADMRNQ